MASEEFRVGEAVRIPDGPFVNFVGVVRAVATTQTGLITVGIDDSNTPQSIAHGVEARVLHDDEVPVDCPRPAKQQTARRKHCE